MRRVGMRSGSWSIEGLAFAESFRERWRGAHLPGTSHGVVIRRSAVHTVGLARRLEVFSVGRDRRVLEVRSLDPNRFAWFRGARYVVELPEDSELPLVGSLVEMTDAG